MLYDLNNIDPKTDHKYRICVIGAGPAGITLANELEKSVGQVCILESGGLTREYNSKSLRSVVSGVGMIKSNSQERLYGGTTLSWGGLSATLDTIDFSYRPFLSTSGWPITFQEISTYYHRASAKYGFPLLSDYDAFQSDICKRMNLPFNLPPELQLKSYLQQQKRIFFGEKFRSLLSDPNVDLYIHASIVKLVSIGTSGNKEKILAAKVMNERGGAFEIKADKFVLAAGCLENARILLLSHDVCTTGIGNQHDLVGRYFMNHPKGFAGEFVFKKPQKEYVAKFGKADSRYKNYFGHVGFRLSDKVQQKAELMNSYVRMQAVFPWMDNAGVQAVILLSKGVRYFYHLQLFRICVKIRSIITRINSLGVNRFVSVFKKVNLLLIKYINNSTYKIIHWNHYPRINNEIYFAIPISLFDHLKLIPRIIGDIIPLIRFAFAWALDRSLQVRKVRIENFMEMEPDFSNRITLSEKTDLNGVYLPKIYYKASLRDKKSLLKIHDLISSNIKRNFNIQFVPELSLNGDWSVNKDASHYLGGTRMGNDAKNSVVDSNLQVHGLKNLFVVGGSVFPTGGNCNPTYTICALAIRLADHLGSFYDKKS